MNCDHRIRATLVHAVVSAPNTPVCATFTAFPTGNDTARTSQTYPSRRRAFGAKQCVRSRRHANAINNSICLKFIRNREEVAWDIDTIYLSHDTRILNLRDFDHLEPKWVRELGPRHQGHDKYFKLQFRSQRLNGHRVGVGIQHILPWIEGVAYPALKRNVGANIARAQTINVAGRASSWGTRFEVKSMTNRKSFAQSLNSTIQLIHFRSDFLHKLAVSVITNNSPAIRTIDLSHNLIEDKGTPFHTYNSNWNAIWKFFSLNKKKKLAESSTQ